MSQRYSIQRYLKLFVLIWVFILSALTTVWVYIDAKHEIGELFDASLVQSSRVLDGLLHLHPLDEEILELETLSNEINQRKHHGDLQDSHSYEKKIAFQIWNKEEGLVFSSASAPEESMAPHEKGFHRVEIDGHGWRTFAMYSEQNKWWLMVAESDDIRDELAEYIVRDHILPLVIGIPILLWVLNFLINKGLIPLDRIAQQLGNRNYRDLKPITDQKTPEEVLGLVNSLNNLFDELQAAYERESRFAADAAHELRNPLASLMIHADNALEDTVTLQQSSEYKDQTEIQQHCKQQIADLKHLKSSIQRLTHSVQQLLALSRAENHLIEEDHVWIDVKAMCQELQKQYHIALQDKNQQLTLDIDDNCKLYGYKTLFSIMITNLISNANKYCPESSRIHLRSYAQSKDDNEQLVFICEDSGEGVSELEMQRVQDRFYRIPSNKTHGAGLGLSIVDAIVKKHRGQWVLDSSKLGGLKVTIYLPNTISASNKS